MKAQQ